MASFLTECQVTLSKDPANYVTDAHGKSVLKPEIYDDVCSVFCHQHGHCVRGKCICDAGYAGDNCHLVAGQGPQLDRIRRFVLVALRTQKLMLSLESRAVSQYTPRIRFRSVLVTASYGHYSHTADRILPDCICHHGHTADRILPDCVCHHGHTADRILPDCVCWIRLPASDSALFFQRNTNPYCAKSARILSGWPGQILAKRIWPGSKLVCKNHRARCLAGRSRPATISPFSDSVAFYHIRPGSFMLCKTGLDHSCCAKPARIIHAVQNQPGSFMLCKTSLDHSCCAKPAWIIHAVQNQPGSFMLCKTSPDHSCCVKPARVRFVFG